MRNTSPSFCLHPKTGGAEEATGAAGTAAITSDRNPATLPPDGQPSNPVSLIPHYRRNRLPTRQGTSPHCQQIRTHRNRRHRREPPSDPTEHFAALPAIPNIQESPPRQEPLSDPTGHLTALPAIPGQPVKIQPNNIGIGPSTLIPTSCRAPHPDTKKSDTASHKAVPDPKLRYRLTG